MNSVKKANGTLVVNWREYNKWKFQSRSFALVQLILFAAVEISLFAAYFRIAANERAANNQNNFLLFKESRQINIAYLLLFKKNHSKYS